MNDELYRERIEKDRHSNLVNAKAEANELRDRLGKVKAELAKIKRCKCS